ncbi:MAG: AAA family ATPase [Lachnospiraceae bacterium]|nr:AAA family ATPase [Lachnospiraceae bacterium]
MKFRELKYTELKNISSPEVFDFKTTDEIEPLDGIMGQDRAIGAFDFGLQVKMKGYNIYMSGPPGTGKTTYAKKSAKAAAKNENVPSDWCYVYNFSDPRSPMALRFEPGCGKQFKDDMAELVEVFYTEIQKAFNSDDYEKQKNEILNLLDNKKDKLMKEMSEIAKEYGFGVKSTNSGMYFMPVINGEIINEESYDKLSEDVKAKINAASDVVQEKAASIMRDVKEHEKESKKSTEALDYKIGMFAIGYYVNSIQEKYKSNERVIKYIEALQEDVLENISEFVEPDSDEEESLSSIIPMLSKRNAEDITLRYKVNLIVDNSETKGAPVVVDFNPTYYNLVGEVEYDSEFGNLTTDFMKIKPGLFHKANGGYLIVQAHDILSNIQAWEALRRVIRTKEIAIEGLKEQFAIAAAPTIKPEPIPADVKIIMIGSRYYYDLLEYYDEDFEKLFKIRADFDYEMLASSENMLKLSSFIKLFSANENTPAFEASAVMAVCEYSSRLAERQDRLSTRFNHLTEILSEAATWARLDEAETINANHVKKAIQKREERASIYKDKLLESIDEDIIMIDTEGKRMGQINGLAVYDTGNFSFGMPSRITATAYMGRAGIINIEKEANMSGPTHNKGVQVINGYLGQTYAQDFPLSLSARICFEQNYSGIDGDSASSTELYCILSSLSGLPIRQDLAVTGSVNQWGDIQPIGGVIFKIEGFFDICKKKGLTGTQGVIIPNSNVNNLVLKDEVVEAVKSGMFHIYAINSINEGIELLMGVPAGERGKTRKYPVKSVHGLVLKKLEEYNKKALNERRRQSKKPVKKAQSR